MIQIKCHTGIKKELLKEFEEEQWPIADKEHYGNNLPNFEKSQYTIIASSESGIVGYIYMSIDMGVTKIDSLLVHSEHQRKGIASSLLKKAELKAAKELCHVLTVETGFNWKAKEFYESHGYEVTVILKEYYDKKDFVLLEKRISSNTQ